MLRFSFFLLLAGIGTGVFAQSPFKNILLDDKGEGYNPCEPSIAINFSNPDNIVAGAILNRVYTSLDGGKTWQTQGLKSSYGVFGDPCVVSDYEGNIHYLHLSDPSQKGWSSPTILDRIVCQSSSDGGVTWNNGGFMGNFHPKDQDKEWAVADPKSGRLYTTWTQFDKYDSPDTADKSNIYFAASKKQGAKWSKAVRINEASGDCLDDDATTEGAVPAAGPKGEVYVAWALNEKIYFDRSTDGGKTWMDKDIVAAEQKGGWSLDIPGINRCNGMPVTVCDLSQGPNRGTLYINWSDQRNGETDTDVWNINSTDGGLTWSQPVRVNDDAPGRQQFLSWLTVDQTTGYLYCVFYDRRDYSDLRTDVYVAVSTDAGKTWKNVKISEKAFTPQKQTFFGDYTNIAAHAGRICPIWTRMDNQRTSVWTSVIRQEDLLGK
ncbi:MAG: exo-alpha-sialidase [Bacteroidetes bacterium]|nr:MAG: exo-alpha-sialidase [Bacteroidota bacterium]